MKQTFRINRIRYKLTYFLSNVQTYGKVTREFLGLRMRNFLGYCFHMNTDMEGDFHICINVPLKSYNVGVVRDI